MLHFMVIPFQINIYLVALVVRHSKFLEMEYANRTNEYARRVAYVAGWIFSRGFELFKITLYYVNQRRIIDIYEFVSVFIFVLRRVNKYHFQQSDDGGYELERKKN